MSRIKVFFQKRPKEISIRDIRRKKRKSKLDKLLLSNHNKLAIIMEILIDYDKQEINETTLIEELRKTLHK